MDLSNLQAKQAKRDADRQGRREDAVLDLADVIGRLDPSDPDDKAKIDAALQALRGNKDGVVKALGIEAPAPASGSPRALGTSGDQLPVFKADGTPTGGTMTAVDARANGHSLMHDPSTNATVVVLTGTLAPMPTGGTPTAHIPRQQTGGEVPIFDKDGVDTGRKILPAMGLKNRKLKPIHDHTDGSKITGFQETRIFSRS